MSPRTSEEPGPGAAADRLQAIGTLAEPSRRALYEHVVRAGDWVSRDEAADALGLERGTAAHHLDRLAADGLLEVDFQRRSGRRGPGAGRPAKLYRRAPRDFEVTLPPRDYALVGRVLADAADHARTAGVPIDAAIDDAAAAEGARLADDMRARVRPGRARGGERHRRALLEALEHRGFEPRIDADGTVVLRNCPFHQLAREHTELVCGMNLCMMRAAISALGETGYEARLEPEEGACCVRLSSG